MIDTARFGIVGDGVTDDAAALERAFAAAEGPVVLPAGDYRLGRTVEWRLAEFGRCGLAGGGVARLVMAAPGPALRLLGSHAGTAAPASVAEGTMRRERLPLVDGLEIVGEHPEADGIEVRGCFKPILTRLFIHDCRHGVHLVERNRDVLIHGCQIYNNRGKGIFLESVNLHQINIADNHLSYNRGGAIHIVGSEVRNLQIVGNDIEYNHGDEQEYVPRRLDSADILLDARVGSIREGCIVGNQIQSRATPRGANIRLLGGPEWNQRQWVGHLAITGNQISNQWTNLHICQAQGVTVTGNTFYGAASRSIYVDRSDYVAIGANVIYRNPDYDRQLPTVTDGIELADCSACTITGLVLARLRGRQDVEVEGVWRGGVIEIEHSREITLSACQVVEAGSTPLAMFDVAQILVSACTFSRQPPEPGAANPSEPVVRVRGTGSEVVIAHCFLGGPIEAPEQGVTIVGIPGTA